MDHSQHLMIYCYTTTTMGLLRILVVEMLLLLSNSYELFCTECNGRAVYVNAKYSVCATHFCQESLSSAGCKLSYLEMPKRIIIYN